MPGHPDWGGQALVHGIDILANGFGVTMGAGQTISFPPFAITRPGYLLNFTAIYPGTNGTSGLCDVDLGWYDAGQNVHFGHEAWRFAVGTNNNGFFHTGRGPTKGQLLQLSFTNRDQNQSAQATFWLAETTQHASRDDLRIHLDGVSPVWPTVDGDDAIHNILSDFQAFSLPTGNAGPALMPLYSGQASVTWAVSGQTAAGQVELIIKPAEDLALHAPHLHQFCGTSPWDSPQAQLIDMSRKVCTLELINHGASTCTVNLSLVAMEYSS